MHVEQRNVLAKGAQVDMMMVVPQVSNVSE